MVCLGVNRISMIRSINYALKCLHPLLDKIDSVEWFLTQWNNRHEMLNLGIVIIFRALIVIPVSLYAKTIVTIICVFTRPRAALAAIPRNWRKLVFCVDSATIPELLPGIE